MVRDYRAIPNWNALYVRSGFEFVVDAHLRASGYESYVPRGCSSEACHDRDKSRCHLFPGYVFSKLGGADTYRIRMIPGVIAVVGTIENAFVGGQTIHSVQRVIESELPHIRVPLPVEGQLVRILGGPLSGLEGMLVMNQEQRSFVISVPLLECGVSVDIGGTHVVALQTAVAWG